MFERSIVAIIEGKEYGGIDGVHPKLQNQNRGEF